MIMLLKRILLSENRQRKSIHSRIIKNNYQKLTSLCLMFLLLFQVIGGVFLFVPKENEVKADVSDSWYSSSWLYRKKITIDYTQVPNTDQTNFPVLVSKTDVGLKSMSNGGKVNNANGYDIIFVSTDGIKLDHEIESYDGVNGTIAMWVKVPTVSHTAPDTAIYLYYGNSSISLTQENKNGVWNDGGANRFQMVQHMNQNPGGTTPQMRDSTTNNNNGVAAGMTSANQATGQAGGAVSFNGLNNYIDANTGVSIDPRIASVQINNSTYDVGGNVFQTDSNTAMLVSREGNSHVGGSGKIFKQSYNLTTKTWDTRSYIYTDSDPNIDARNPASGIIGNKIFVFFARYNYSTSSFIDMGYIYSTNLAGTSWSNYASVSTSPITTQFSPQGQIIATNDPNTFIVPIYGWTSNQSAVYATGYLKTTDGGVTWSPGVIYNGMNNYNETAIEHIGNGKLIALSRNEAGGPLVQSVSADNGVTWSVPTTSNLGVATGIKTPYLFYDSESGNIFCIYQDRGDSNIKVSKTNGLSAYNNPIGWNISEGISTNFLGMPSMVKVASNNYFFVYDYEVNSSSTQIYGGYYPNPQGITLSAWVKLNSYTPSSANPDQSMIIEKGTLYRMSIDASSHQLCTILAPYLSTKTCSPTIIPLNAWTFVSVSYDNTNVYWYVNGNIDKTLSKTSLNFSGASRIYIGADAGYGRYTNGSIDEIRVSSIARSPDWLQTEYNNQSSPGIFLSLSSEESPNHLAITGTTTQTVGTTQTITLIAKTNLGNTYTSYTGDKTLTLSGPTTIGSNIPTFTDKDAHTVNFGSSGTIHFTNGVATTVIELYKAETSEIDATDGTYSTTGNALNVSVSPSTIDSISATSPSNITSETPFNLTLTSKDAYGNTTTNVTNSTTLSINYGTINPSSIPNTEFQDNGTYTNNITISEIYADRNIVLTIRNGSITQTINLSVTGVGGISIS